MNRTLFLIVLGGLVLAHVLSSIGDALIRKGALLLDRDTMDRVWSRQMRSSSVWKGGETLAVVVMVAGLLKAWAIIPGKEHWGIPAVAIGFGLFCLASVLRAWLCRSAFAAEAPGSSASRGAMAAGILTTLAECAVGVAVCGYIYTHLPSTRSSSPSPSASQTTATNDTTSSGWISESQALELLPGKDVKYLKALAESRLLHARKNGSAVEYNRDQLIQLKEAGLPSPDELNMDADKDKDKEKDKDQVKE